MSLTTILYVEDEPDIRSIAELALATVGGYQLISCDSGEAALLEAPQAQPDLLLLDVMMPGMDGPQTLKHLREVPGLETVPAIFMTAKVQPEEVAEYRALGAADVIAKPFDPLMLATQVQAIYDAAGTD